MLFVNQLKKAGISDTLSLDIAGWSYSWFRELLEDTKGSRVQITQKNPKRDIVGGKVACFWI